MRLESEVISGPQLMNTINMLNCTGQVSETNHVVIPNTPEYDRFSNSYVQNKHDHTCASQLHNDEIVLDVDDDSQYDFLHLKSTSRSPSVIWDEKSEFMKAADLKFSDDTQDLKPLLMNSGSSKVQVPARTRSLNQAKPFPIISDFPRSSCDQDQFEEANETENYVDALNTLESEAETDSECQAKCMQSLSKMEDQKNESGVPGMAQYYSYSNIEVPMSFHDSSNKYRLPSDTQEAGTSPGSPYDGSQLLENTVLTMSRTNAFHGTDDDQHSWSIDSKSETVLSCETTAATSQIQTTPSISISNIPYSKLWTNGNLLGLEPSKPVDVSLPNRTEEGTPSSSMNNDVKSDKENLANGQISKQLNSIGKVLVSHESLSLVDQRILNSNPFLNRKYLVEKNSSIKHSSTYVSHNEDVFDIQQNSQEQSEAPSFIEREGSQAAFPDLLGASQVHQTTKSAFSKEFEPCGAFSTTSSSMDSSQNSKCLSRFSGLPQRNLVQCLHVKPSDTCAKSSTQYERMNDDYNQSEEKPLVDNRRKRLNGVASQTFSEQNLASETFHEQSLINKTNYGLLEKSISSGSRYSQNSSPPLVHMKISFHPMNSLESSNLKLELPDGCINERIDGNVSPSFRLFSGCTLSSHSASESDDDTFCKSYSNSTEDLLSAHSDSNSDLWEQDDYSGSKTNEPSDDLRRISSSTASISNYSGFEQMNLVNKEIGLKDICTGNDANSFQPCYITNIPTFESLINQDVKYDSLSISPKNAMLAPTELPPPPPLPPIQWRLVRSSYDISEEDNCSNIAQMVNHFEEPQNQKPPAPTEIENIIRWPLPLAEDQQYKNMVANSVDSLFFYHYHTIHCNFHVLFFFHHFSLSFQHDNQKLDSLLQTHELDRSEQSLRQIRDMVSFNLCCSEKYMNMMFLLDCKHVKPRDLI